MSDVQTLEDLAALFRLLRRRHARTLEEKVLPYRELAARTGWSHAVISDYFSGKVLPPTDRFDLLVQLLGATPVEQGPLATARDRVEENRCALSGSGRRQPAGDTERPAVSNPAVVVPRQLPAAPRWFTGRIEELAALSAGWNRGPARASMRIAAIAGAGGMGKTWLALNWAHQHLDRFPDGHLFVDLQGFSSAGEPMRPTVAVRGFLSALGVDPRRIPPDLHDQTALYRSLVADKRILVLLDNAADADQVVPLLPGSASCTVVVTSRRHLTSLMTRHGAHHIGVGVLTHDEARHLLTTRLGQERIDAEPGAVTELLACCAGYPLALSIVAGRIGTIPAMALANLVADLRDTATRVEVLDDDDPAASLPTALSWSLRGLTREQRTAFGLLGIAPGPDIGLPAAASLTGLPPAQAKRVLRALEEASLLDRDARDRYSMHDLIRAYAATIADEHHDTGTAAMRRILDFYTHTAHTANHLLYPNRAPIPLGAPAAGTHLCRLPDTPAAMSWFDTEHPNLLAAHHTATTHHWHQIIWQLTWTLNTYQFRRGHRHDRLALWREALAAATHLPDPALRTIAHQLLGHANADLDRHHEAIEHLHLALALATDHHNPALQAHVHQTLAWAWERQKDDQQAFDHSATALDLYRTLNEPAWEAEALNAVGWCAARLGDYDTARDHCDAALTLHRDHRNPTGEADTLDSLGYIDHHTGRYQQAIDHYRHALTLRRHLGHTTQVADVLDQLGHAYSALNQHQHAHSSWREALEMYREQGRDTNADRVQEQLDQQHSTTTNSH